MRGRLTVGRLTLDQVVKVRILAPQPHENPAQAECFVAETAINELAELYEVAVDKEWR